MTMDGEMDWRGALTVKLPTTVGVDFRSLSLSQLNGLNLIN
jgi:hypothetical protein